MVLVCGLLSAVLLLNSCPLLLLLVVVLQALLLHNQVMKHACYDNIGYVLEQEGDSFTLAFHEPTDAVAFTLQVSTTHNASTTPWHQKSMHASCTCHAAMWSSNQTRHGD